MSPIFKPYLVEIQAIYLSKLLKMEIWSKLLLLLNSEWRRKKAVNFLNWYRTRQVAGLCKAEAPGICSHKYVFFSFFNKQKE